MRARTVSVYAHLVHTREEDFALRADFVITAGERVPFVLTWHPSHEPASAPIDPFERSPTRSRSGPVGLLQLVRGRVAGGGRPFTAHAQGAHVRAHGRDRRSATTSLPEWPGGVRNWDYRYCWLRDAAITLLALTRAGFRDEAKAWHAWLLRAIAGDPAEIQAVYGVAGERRLTELELPWLSGYENSTPVRIGNQAAGQFQLDLYGEVVNTIHQARRAGLEDNGEAWSLTRALVDFVEAHWHLPDEGLWEVRGPRRHFVSSKVMAWVAVDRALSDAEELGLPAPLARWRALREQIRRQVLARGYDAVQSTFTQSFGSKEIDASALLLPLVGFLPASDERMRGTVAAIERQLVNDGLVYRYTTSDKTNSVDGLPEGEAPSSPAASGSRRTTRSQDGWTRHARSSSACSRSKTTSVSSPRSTTPAPDGSSATSRRPSATSPSSCSPTSSTKSPSEDAQRKP